MSDALGYYQLLQVPADADVALIKSSYRDLAKFWHPDRNTTDGALEVFQKLSEAWEVLEDDERRLQYDLLSLVYREDNYPDIENIRPYYDGTPDIRAMSLHSVRGQIWKHKAASELKVCAFKPAVAAHFKTAAANWLLGWWSPQAFVRNIRALLADWKNPVSAAESLRVLVHNTVAYQILGRPQQAVESAVRALEYADETARAVLQNFIQKQGLRVRRPKVWNLALLKAVQLAVPALMVSAALVPAGTAYISEGELWNWFAEKQEIDYYQEVRFAGQGSSSVDDVVVGKIMNIPVDRSDISNLYHLKAPTKIMYAPGDEFDVLKELAAGTTVRLTGRSPDNVWLRVMIDNGEMGFVRSETLEKGIGAEIPYGSEIFKK